MLKKSVFLVLVILFSLLVVGSVYSNGDPEPLPAGPVASECQRDTDCSNLGDFCVQGACFPRLCDPISAPCPSGSSCQNLLCMRNPPSCSSNQECPIGRYCYNNICSLPCSGDTDCLTVRGDYCYQNPPGSAGTCLPRCTSDSQCPSNNLCRSGICQPRCTSDSQCSLRNYCYQSVCTPYCIYDYPDCVSGDNCIDINDARGNSVNRCGKICSSDSQCNTAAGEYCYDRLRLCVPRCGSLYGDYCTQGDVCRSGTCRRSCTNNADCGSGQHCESFYDVNRQLLGNSCVSNCQSNSDCGTNSVCNVTSGICQQCVSNSQCSTGWVCSSGTCRAPCQVSTCPSDQYCASDGLCNLGCRDTRDCSNGRVCNNNQCVTACLSNSQCLNTEYCDALTNFCRPRTAGYCNSDSDCGSNYLCINNQCSSPSYTGVCGSGNAFSRWTCSLDGKACLFMSSSGTNIIAGQVCSITHRCLVDTTSNTVSCVPKSDDGINCRSDNECRSGICNRGICGGINLTFTIQNSGIRDDLNDVFFLDGSNGWVVGNSGRILKTVDGGTTWTQQNSGVNVNLNKIYFLNDTYGWVVGDPSNTITILYTNDGGDNWLPYSIIGSLGACGLGTLSSRPFRGVGLINTTTFVDTSVNFIDSSGNIDWVIVSQILGTPVDASNFTQAEIDALRQSNPYITRQSQRSLFRWFIGSNFVLQIDPTNCTNFFYSSISNLVSGSNINQGTQIVDSSIDSNGIRIITDQRQLFTYDLDNWTVQNLN